MKERYESKIEKGIIPTGNYGLDLYNRIVGEQFDEAELEDMRNLSQEVRLLRNGFRLIPHSEPGETERIIFRVDDYFLETRTDTDGTKEFLLYDDGFKIIVKSADINEILGLWLLNSV